MDLAQAYQDGNSWGISAMINLHQCNPDKLRDAEVIKQFVVELCELIEVKRFGECTVVHFGEREEIAGFSMVQLIETSLVSGHFVNKTNNIYLDVFSCKYFDPEAAAAKAAEFFEAKDMTLNYQLRK